MLPKNCRGAILVNNINFTPIACMQMFLLFNEAEEDCSTKSAGFVTEVGTFVDLEQKVLSLESTIKDRDAALAKLRDELDAVKVITSQ